MLLTTVLFANTALGCSSRPVSRLYLEKTQNFVSMKFPDEMESSNAAFSGAGMNMVNVRAIEGAWSVRVVGEEIQSETRPVGPI